MKIGDTLTALMVANPDGSRTIFAQMLGETWFPFVFAERAAFDRTLAKTKHVLDAMKTQKGIKFEVCTYSLSDRSPLE